jgi:hypothetical protein
MTYTNIANSKVVELRIALLTTNDPCRSTRSASRRIQAYPDALSRSHPQTKLAEKRQRGRKKSGL